MYYVCAGVGVYVSTCLCKNTQHPTSRAFFTSLTVFWYILTIIFYGCLANTYMQTIANGCYFFENGKWDIHRHQSYSNEHEHEHWTYNVAKQGVKHLDLLMTNKKRLRKDTHRHHYFAHIHCYSGALFHSPFYWSTKIEQPKNKAQHNGIEHMSAKLSGAISHRIVHGCMWVGIG